MLVPPPPALLEYRDKLPLVEKDDMVEVSVVVAPAVGLTFVPTVSDAQLIVPEPSREALVLIEALLERVIPPVTVRVIPELTVSVPRVEAVLLNVIDITEVFPVTVMSWPGNMMTSSAAVGATPPTQVAPTFQLPSAKLVMVRAKAEFDEIKRIAVNAAPFKNFTKASAYKFFKW